MCKQYYLSKDENVLLVRERGESRILANWRDLEERHRFSARKLSEIERLWEINLSSLGQLIEDGKLDEYLTLLIESENEGVARIAKQLGGDKMAELLAREIWRG